MSVQLWLQAKEGQEVSPDRGLHPVANRRQVNPTIKEVIQMVTGVFIPHDEDRPLEIREFEGLKAYQASVQGNIEAIDILTMNASFYCNEEAKIFNLPINRRATLMWWMDSPQMRHRDTINGNAIIIGLPDEEGDTQDAPKELMQLLFEAGAYRAMYETADSPDSWNGNSVRYTDYFIAAGHALIKFDEWYAVTRCKIIAA
ncbi:DUF3846 domain-containing protein [Subtercola sp. RTI3]|uniref:DUF3846 domain-containing protein n=1 Tax=Subtercola sp. RTI3 TaxID=3048639 RepID=UPI002B228F3F|nr:DUF3846 domain-containing protein [Subtercola sp. RTI3]MEA9985677.1 DUF3846 domain-containing protein [Subtercola sp. RTI3]